ncbi:ATP phosphoribosyltransferase [Myxozyma melibiosi]|uniref:ATP phosphoribosyltransferase n=1 Tax=Myxozyma melibiosi TaxID=54550 RepID=A0ABR1EZ41_9ASCO
MHFSTSIPNAVSHMNDRLLFAIPKKGRLHRQCMDLLKGADIQFTRANRLDLALSTNLPITLVFLPAADIPLFVGEGRVDLGITGQDQVAESAQTANVDELCDLGFGGCKLQVEVPDKGEFTQPEQLIGKSVVTSFPNLARTYFRSLEQIPPDAPLKTNIKYVGGSVEASCALGIADAVVDLVESGETMRAAGLKAIATVFTTSAVLIANKNPDHADTVALVVKRIMGVLSADKYVLCNYNCPRDKIPQVLKITPGRRAPAISPLENEEWVAVSSLVEKKKVAEVMDQLKLSGAEDILVLSVSNSRV